MPIQKQIRGLWFLIICVCAGRTGLAQEPEMPQIPAQEKPAAVNPPPGPETATEPPPTTETKPETPETKPETPDAAAAPDRGQAKTDPANTAQPNTGQPDLAQRIGSVKEQMQQARTQLADKKTGAPTQDLQKSILAELDALLKSPPQKSPPNSGGGGGNSQSSSSSSSSSQQQAQRQNQQQQAGQDQQQAGASGQQQQPTQAGQPGEQQDRQTADDSEERTGQRREAAAAALPRRRLEVDVWGHLPDKVREKLLNAYGERMVPEYEDMVQRFYRSLAESGRRDSAS